MITPENSSPARAPPPSPPARSCRPPCDDRRSRSDHLELELGGQQRDRREPTSLAAACHPRDTRRRQPVSTVMPPTPGSAHDEQPTRQQHGDPNPDAGARGPRLLQPTVPTQSHALTIGLHAFVASVRPPNRRRRTRSESRQGNPLTRSSDIRTLERRWHVVIRMTLLGSSYAG